MNKKKVKYTAYSAGAVLIVALMLTLLLMWYSNGFESVKKLYVTVNGKNISSELTLPKESKARFEVNGASFKLDSIDYTVTITPNAEYDFEYTVNDETRKFSEAGELTKAFDIELHEGYFEIACDSDGYGVEKVLKQIHGESVELSDGFEPGMFYYILTIAANKRTVTAQFRFHVPVTGIEINPPEVIIQ